jgi:hypothetical protein
MRSQKPAGKQKRSVQKKVDWKALELVHPDAAGIDVGGSEHWVAMSPDRPRAGSAFYRRSAGDGPLAGRKRRAQDGHEVDWRVLDAGL